MPRLARRHGVDPLILAAWLDFLGISTTGTGVRVDSVLTAKITKASGFDFVNGWGSGETPNVFANSSDQHVRIPGNLKPHSVAMHPSPSLRVVAGWKSPVTAVMRVKGTVQHAARRNVAMALPGRSSCGGERFDRHLPPASHREGKR